MFWRKKKQESAPAPKARGSIFSTDLADLSVGFPSSFDIVSGIKTTIVEGTEDSANLMADAAYVQSVPDAQMFWYASQSFIGYQACAIMAQHWLIDRACSMPGRDAIRQGYEVKASSPEIVDRIKKLDRKYGINRTMSEFIQFGRVYGIRIAIFRVNSSDPDYYEKPFNIDGVTPKSYIGISQVDPIWCAPILTGAGINDPASIRFYEPQFWLINGKKYHRSHLCVYIPHQVPDMLKPSYQYGGVSIPQLIYERVYASERTANEAPQLALSKRTGVLKVAADAFMSNLSSATAALQTWAGIRDNYGVKIVDKDAEDYTQFDTSLADLDATIMTQYQLVAAIADVPATKLLGTQPKGFNATGEHEAENYRQSLESIQTNDLQPLLERHHELLMRSEIGSEEEIAVSWEPLDSPTAAEWAAINLQKAQAAQIYAALGAIDDIDIRDQLMSDKNSDFHGLAEIENPEKPEPDLEDDPTQETASVEQSPVVR